VVAVTICSSRGFSVVVVVVFVMSLKS